MSDESSRSARPYGQRRNDGAPTWWAALDRADLPDNEGAPAAHRRWYEDSHSAALEAARPQTGHSRRRGWIIGVVAALAVALILAAEWSVDNTGRLAFVTILICVPVVLAAATAVVVARRSR